MIKIVSEIISTVVTNLIHGDQIIHQQHQYAHASDEVRLNQRNNDGSNGSFFANRRNNLWRIQRDF